MDTDPLALNHNPDVMMMALVIIIILNVSFPEFVGNTGGNMTVFLTSEQ